MKILILLIVMLTSLSANAQSIEEINSVAVERHNLWRNMLNIGLDDHPVPNPYLSDVVYDPEMQSVSTAFAENCVFSHGAVDRGSYGENLYAGWGSGSDAIVQAIDMWAEEHKIWSYGTGWSSGTGHFTQVVWESTKKISCAAHYCSDGVKDANGNVMFIGTLAVCHYSPAGNWYGKEPYSLNGTTVSEFDGVNSNLMLSSVKVGEQYYRAKLLWNGEKFSTISAHLTDDTTGDTIFNSNTNILNVNNVKYNGETVGADLLHIGDLNFIF